MTQAITISPSTSCLSSFKHKFTNYVIYIFVFSWCHSLSCSSYLIFYTVASSNVNQTQLLSLSELCSLSPTKFIIHELFSTLKTSCDITFIGIVLRSSAYMVILLFKPHRRSQHLHITNFSPRVSPEKRATHTMMLLMSFFGVMYWMNLIMSSLAILFWVNNSVILGIQKLVVNVYATVSPSVLIISDTRITNILQFMQ
ncbi:vomeronasal type-1 receptor 90-like [Panthera tigris]|uniref:vomeronasal type-1 receptor 90-like n=1 Tax=Panthera tigris TaxID=9694 RepID=UPI001C6F6229|nr:vomeronasal type-1 receptor 90-like [Panthera tigris]